MDSWWRKKNLDKQRGYWYEVPMAEKDGLKIKYKCSKCGALHDKRTLCCPTCFKKMRNWENN